jgi:hypothetical protein
MLPNSKTQIVTELGSESIDSCDGSDRSDKKNQTHFCLIITKKNGLKIVTTQKLKL